MKKYSAKIKSLAAEGKARWTGTTAQQAAAMGLSEEQIVVCVCVCVRVRVCV